MYHVYNTVLRRYPPDAFAALRDGGNLFPATIHALGSAVVKVPLPPPRAHTLRGRTRSVRPDSELPPLRPPAAGRVPAFCSVPARPPTQSSRAGRRPGP